MTQQQSRRRASQLSPRVQRFLQEAMLALASELDQEQLLEDTVAMARRLVRSHQGILAIVDDSGRIERLITSGLSAAERSTLGPLPTAKGLLQKVLTSGRPLRAAAEDLKDAGLPPGHPPVVSLLALPLTVQGAGRSVLVLTNKQGSAAFTEEDEEATARLVGYAQVAIANAVRFAEVERYARGWRLLAQVGRRVVESLNQRAVLHALVDGARSLLGTDVAFLALMAPGGKSLQVVAATGLHTRAMRRLRLGLDQGIAGAVLVARGPLLVDDYLSDPRLKGSALKEVTAEGLVSLLAVPFGTKGRPEGVLYVANRHRTSFTSQQAQLLEAMANLADLAVAHGRVHGRGRRRLRVMEARQRHLQAVIEAIPAGVIIVEAPSGRVSMANGAAAHILAPDGGPTPSNIFDFALYRSDGTPLPRQEGPRARALAGEPSTGRELLVERRDGSRLPVLVNAASLRDEHGAVAEVVLVLEDISQVKELDRLKDEFLSMVSHDLRTPLTTMKTMADGLAFDEGMDEEARRRQAEALDEEIDRMAALVTNLLDMSRIRAGAMTPEPEECHILDIAQDALRELELAHLTRDHRIATDISPQLPLVYADPHQLQRVLVNLLSNAVKYSAPGTSVTVAAGVAHDRGELAISVQDQGVGIPPEELPHIFEKFYRRTGRDRRGRKGTGLGLAISKALVELNGGRIWVESTPGQGSTFFFAIPMARGTVNAGNTGQT